MNRFQPAWRAITALGAASVLVATAVAAPVSARQRGDENFNHVASFDVRLNGTEAAEIVDATHDGQTLVYSDSATGAIGFVDVTDPSSPAPDGTIDVGGEPTSVAVGKQYILVAVNTSPDFDNPTGQLHVINQFGRTIDKTFPLGGQPDSIAISPNGRYAAIVLENERDEDENDGLIPQAPAGQLVVVDMKGDPDWWPLRYVDFTDLDMMAASDPEPEYVDINKRNKAVVTFQENNHLAIVDLTTGRIANDFSAGEVTLENVDATEDEFGPQGNGIISLSETITRRREPDTVNWLDNDSFATANEGDYEDADGDEGGSRGFTIFNIDGRVEYESYTAFEYASIRAGHYNEGRSANKGGEPEALEFGEFGRDDLLFVGSERANILGVYNVNRYQPQLVQMLPTGIGPEGIKAIGKRDLLVVANETSEGDIPSMLTIYERQPGAAAYPQLVSGDDAAGLPIPWVANSGMVGDPTDADVVYAVSDSILAEARIYRIDTSDEPAVITDVTVVTDPSGDVRRDLDLEGIAVAPDGGFWLASEGRNDAETGRPNSLVHVDAAGVVLDEVELPAELLADGWTSSGFEGVAVSDDGSAVYTVIQRPWAGDAAGTTKLARYDLAAGTWGFVAYPVDPVESPNGGWVGLSEITNLGDGEFAIIERDNQLGTDARIKKVYGVDLGSADFQPYSTGTAPATVSKTLLADLLPVLEANSVWTPDKMEGLAVTADGDVYISTDNDGLDEAIGQTLFVNLGSDALGG